MSDYVAPIYLHQTENEPDKLYKKYNNILYFFACQHLGESLFTSKQQLG